MTLREAIVWFLLILVADIIAATIAPYIKRLWNKPLDLGCDYCEEPKPLSRAPDRQHWLCRQCMEAFVTEHQGEFTDEQVSVSRKGFRRRRRKKRR